MHVHSLGFRTDLVFARFGGHVEDRGDHLVVTTPQNPTYHWGNFLLFDRPPDAGDAERWIATFRAAFAHEPRVRHVSIGWDRSREPRVEAAPFVALGFAPLSLAVLTATSVREPAHVARDVTVRELVSDADWESLLNLETLVRDPGIPRERFVEFKREQQRQYRRMAAQGAGGWFGAFAGERLVGSLGLFVTDGVGRFQHVITHPEHRRRGVCSRLVLEIARHGLAALGARTLVMVAEAGEPAERIYESVGFAASERQAGVCRVAGGSEAPGACGARNAP